MFSRHNTFKTLEEVARCNLDKKRKVESSEAKRMYQKIMNPQKVQ